MTDQSKKLKNPLFSAFVTGGTLEDFSQNAILLPAKEKPPPPTLNMSHEQILNDIISPKSRQESEPPPLATSYSDIPIPTNTSERKISRELPDISVLQPHLNTQPSQTSNLSSVFSSFSSILHLGSSNNNEEVVVQPPAGIENFISQDTHPPQPVPLFSPSNPEFLQQKPPSITTGPGPSNQFRRGGLKRPTYAQIPDLYTTNQTVPQIPPNNHPPVNQNLFIPPATESTQFKPISPPPPSYSIPQPVIPVPIQPAPTSHYFSNQPSLSGTILTPVMDSINANQLSPGSHLNAHLNNNDLVNGNGTPQVTTQIYRPVYHHWFFQKDADDKKCWQPFSTIDSFALEQAFTSNDLDPDKVIATDGGRYDVNILRRQRKAVYWKAVPTEVRRCSWFYKNSPDGRLIPYEENIATKLEEEYKIAFERNQWHREIKLTDDEMIVLHGPDVLVLFSQTPVADAWGNTTNQSRPKIVKRGMDEFDIDEGEPAQVDHILFMVHGIGSVCDLKFRKVEEVVDEFRNIALQLVQSHYKSSCDLGKVNRVEVLPISWHDRLHSEETGIDEQLKNITLESIPKLRGFTNDTLLDILFYTSPVYCQKIISTVGNELNRIYELFKSRNPDFKGGVSLGGHSLGSLILFDLLCHQDSKPETDSDESDELPEKPDPKDRRMNKRISYMMGAIGTGQPQIHYPRLNFDPKNFFALGSPIGMFVIVRGLDNLGENFSLPTCPSFFNIFHPYDPIAYRIESLINPKFAELKPVLVPHHKGRKRMHLELKETMARLGADLKQKVIDSMKNTWNSVYHLTMFQKQSPPNLEEEVNKVFMEQMSKEEESESVPENTDVKVGQLNGGRRVDYVLQEAPVEFINDYVFALTSHVCYWESEDSILLILKEIYSSMGLTTDNQIPQQSMTIERRPSNTPPESTTSQQTMGMDPTKPLQAPVNIQPPPIAGFVRKT